MTLAVTALRREPGQASVDSVAFWLSVAVLIVYSQVWIFPLIGDEEPLGGGSNPLIRAAYYPVYLITLMLLVGVWRKAMAGLMQTWPLVVLVGLALASFAWSADPGATMRRGVAIAFTSLSGVLLAARFGWRDLARVTSSAYAILVVVSYFVGLFVPSLGRMHLLFPEAWRGLWSEKNTLGGEMVIAFGLFAATAVLDRKRAALWSAFAIAAIGLVLLSTSKTSLLSLLVGAAAFGGVWLLQRGPVTAIVVSWVGVVGAAGAALVLSLEPQLLLNALGKDATLTGRTQLWSAALRQAEIKPWLGWGYGAIWDNVDPFAPLAKITAEGGFRARHAHSAWVETRLGLGWAGVAALAMFMAQAWLRAIIAAFKLPGALLAVPFLMVFTVISLTESLALQWNDLRWVLLVAFSVRVGLAQGEPSEPGQVA